MKQRHILNLGQVRDLLPLTAIQIQLHQFKQRDTTAEGVKSVRMSWHWCQGKLCSSSASDRHPKGTADCSAHQQVTEV